MTLPLGERGTSLRRLKSYPKTRVSGVEWLRDVPAHWEVRKLRHLLRTVADRNRADLPLLSVVREKGVVVRDVSDRDQNHNFVPDDLTNYKVVRERQFAMNKMKAWQGSYGVSDFLGIVSPAYFVFDIRNVNPDYFHKAIRSATYVRYFARASDGVRIGQWDLSLAQMREVPFAVPSVLEQAAIVRFLDHADRRIRRYVRAKQKLIALLEEQKQAIIQQAVTGQIDVRTRQRYPTYKQTHVEGIRDIPEHWDVIALKRVLTNLIDCEHRTAPAVAQSKYNVVRTSAVRAGVLSWEGTYCTNSSAFAEWTRRGIPRFGDVIFPREAPAGEACLVPKARRVCLGQRTVLLRPDPTRYDSSFLIHMIYGGPPRVRVQLASQGSTVGHFNVDDIGWMPVLVPPLKEQQEIVAVLGSYNSKVERAQRCLERELRLFHEYRIRLIADVVTGKLDVREVACNLPATAPLSTGARNEVASTEPEAAATGRDNFNDLGHIGRNGDRTLVDT